MERSSTLYFIALLPPVEVAEEVTQIKQSFVRNYGSRAALKSPPHVTLQPTFHWETEKRETLTQTLEEFARSHAPIPITLSGFGAFPPRVIYINVLKTPQLMQVRSSLFESLTSQFESIAEGADLRPFSPHVTVATRDLKERGFQQAWQQFQERSISWKFTVTELTLLRHDGSQWNIETQFPFVSK